MPSYAQILLPLPFNVDFTYRVPDDMVMTLGVGHRVIVPFGSRKYYTGIVRQIGVQPPDGVDVKDIAGA